MTDQRPFRVFYRPQSGKWALEQRPQGSSPSWLMYGFATAGDAIDYAYKHWPWWP